MFRSGSAAVAMCALGLLTVGSGSAAAATCTSATENAVTYNDAYGDAEGGLAPDIVRGAVLTVSNCGFGVAYDVGNQAAMADGDFVGWFIDTDDNRATGSQTGFPGADHAIGRLANGYVDLSRYSAATDSFETVREGFPLGEFGAGVSLSDFDASPQVTFRVAGASLWMDPYGGAYFDFAPEAGTIGFGVQFASASSPGSAPVQPTQPTQPAQPVQPQQPAQQVPAPGQDPIRTTPTVIDRPAKCRVPVLRGRTLADAKRRLKQANCRAGRIARVKSTRYAGRVVRSVPGSGRTLAKGAKVNLVVAKPRARASIAVVSDAVAANRAINALAQAG